MRMRRQEYAVFVTVLATFGSVSALPLSGCGETVFSSSALDHRVVQQRRSGHNHNDHNAGMKQPYVHIKEAPNKMAGGAVPVSVNCAFDGGNIAAVNTEDCTTALGVQVKIRDDPYTEFEQKNHKQWFYFRAAGGFRGINATFSIVNAAEVSFLNAWPGSQIVYSYDRKEWIRCQSTRWHADKGHLTWSLTPAADVVWFAYFAPYSLEQHNDLIAMCATSPLAKVEEIGKSLDGRAIDLVVAGAGPLKCWVIHRQHPGETQAEWFAEGLLERLLAPSQRRDGLVSSLLKQYTFHIIPNMCPDGSFRGHLRTNAAGANLNREWSITLRSGDAGGDYIAPTLARSPEVYHTLNRLDATGCDVCVDVHGDETLPYNFIAGMEGQAKWGPRLKGLQGLFTNAYMRANSDIQNAKSYAPDKPGTANLAICSKQIAARFDCLSVSLEMAYKDCISNPDAIYGWSPERCKKLGASLLDALAHVAPYLRTTDPFWEALPPADTYRTPSEGTATG
jgi:murein tripeptide amidase MpaA